MSVGVASVAVGAGILFSSDAALAEAAEFDSAAHTEAIDVTPTEAIEEQPEVVSNDQPAEGSVVADENHNEQPAVDQPVEAPTTENEEPADQPALDPEFSAVDRTEEKSEDTPSGTETSTPEEVADSNTETENHDSVSDLSTDHSVEDSETVETNNQEVPTESVRRAAANRVVPRSVASRAATNVSPYITGRDLSNESTINITKFNVPDQLEKDDTVEMSFEALIPKGAQEGDYIVVHYSDTLTVDQINPDGQTGNGAPIIKDGQILARIIDDRPNRMIYYVLGDYIRNHPNASNVYIRQNYSHALNFQIMPNNGEYTFSYKIGNETVSDTGNVEFSPVTTRGTASGVSAIQEISDSEYRHIMIVNPNKETLNRSYVRYDQADIDGMTASNGLNNVIKISPETTNIRLFKIPNGAPVPLNAGAVNLDELEEIDGDMIGTNGRPIVRWDSNQQAIVQLSALPDTQATYVVVQEGPKPSETGDYILGGVFRNNGSNDEAIGLFNATGNVTGSATGDAEQGNYTIGNYVWFDEDRDGIQDSQSKGVANTVVILRNSNSQEIARTVTDSNGNYQFTNLSNGQYYVEFVPPEGYLVTTTNSSEDRELDSR